MSLLFIALIQIYIKNRRSSARLHIVVMYNIINMLF